MVLIQSPYDFPLPLRVINNYSKPGGENVESLQIGARIGGKPAVITVKIRDGGEFDISSYPVIPAAEVDAIVG